VHYFICILIVILIGRLSDPHPFHADPVFKIFADLDPDPGHNKKKIKISKKNFRS